MDFLKFLAPVAFVMALAALSQVTSLKKEIKQLKKEIDKTK